MKKYVLLVGTSNSGKTSIFSQVNLTTINFTLKDKNQKIIFQLKKLAFKQPLLTQTSITPNHHSVVLEKNVNSFFTQCIGLMFSLN